MFIIHKKKKIKKCLKLNEYKFIHNMKLNRNKADQIKMSSNIINY